MHCSFLDSGSCPLWPGAGPSFSTTGSALRTGINDECRIRVQNVAWRRWFMCGDLRETRRTEKGQSEVWEGFFLIGIFSSLRTGHAAWRDSGISEEHLPRGFHWTVTSWDVLTKSECPRTCIRGDTGKADLQIFLCTPSVLGRFLRTRNLFLSALCFCKALWINRMLTLSCFWEPFSPFAQVFGVSPPCTVSPSELTMAATCCSRAQENTGWWLPFSQEIQHLPERSWSFPGAHRVAMLRRRLSLILATTKLRWGEGRHRTEDGTFLPCFKQRSHQTELFMKDFSPFFGDVPKSLLPLGPWFLWAAA